MNAMTRHDRAPTIELNYPNPSNAETVIPFALRQSGNVGLVVYNLAGQKLVRLAAGSLKPEACTFRWNGRDDAGRELASSVYVYPIRAGAELLPARKMVLIR